MSNVRPIREGDAFQSEDEIRTNAQNRRFHAMVRDIAEQVKWAGELMDEKEWKLLLLAAHYGQRMVPNPLHPEQPFIVVNTRRSSGLTVPSMADFLMELEVFGNERGVHWGREQ